MADAPAVTLAVALRRLHDEPASLLLRADIRPAVVAILHAQLGGTQRVKAAHEFLQQLTDDLADLRGAGFDLPRTAAEYLGEWVRQGLIVRRPGDGRDETVELSPSAQQSVRFVTGLHSPRSSVTSSRLTNVLDMLERLSRDTDPAQESRLEVLHRERARLDAEIEAVEAGRFEPLSDDLALERIAEVLRLAGEIPGDFAQVGADFETLNRELREQIIRQAGSRGEVLDEVFSGVDLIEQSDAGRTFGAFFALACVIPVARRLGLAYAVFILINILPPLAAGGMLSLGRFSSVMFPAFIWCAAAIPVRHRSAWLATFMGLQALNATLFYTWRELF